jgi:hypothetical protein
LQLAELGRVQTPFWQTAGGMQGGPFVSLQFCPSAAAARHVPPVHFPLEPQSAMPPSATPQAIPPPAMLAAVHLSVAAAQ